MLNMWRKIECNSNELQLLGTLNGGQSFRWTFKNNEWLGIFDKTVWKLKQDDTGTYFQVLGSLLANSSSETNIPKKKRKIVTYSDDDRYLDLLSQYFQLNFNLKDYYEDWINKDNNFAKVSKKFYGIRVLNQEPIENIFSFICSSNNNISRITSLVEKLCTNYGKKICELDEVAYYSFPEVQALAADEVENELRKLGFGYRAKYINQTAKMITDLGGEHWVKKLKEMDYSIAKEKLMQFSGIGPKVADCICLMSLGHLGSVPVDTHVFQIACSPCYLPHLSKSKTVTKNIYQEIGDYFRELYGPLAGWAQTILFCGDLKSFNAETSINNKKCK